MRLLMVLSTLHPPLGCFTPALDLTGDSKDLPSAPHHGPPSAVSNAGPYHEARGPWPEAKMEGGTRQTAGRRTGECIRQAGGLGRNAPHLARASSARAFVHPCRLKMARAKDARASENGKQPSAAMEVKKAECVLHDRSPIVSSLHGCQVPQQAPKPVERTDQ